MKFFSLFGLIRRVNKLIAMCKCSKEKCKSGHCISTYSSPPPVAIFTMIWAIIKVCACIGFIVYTKTSYNSIAESFEPGVSKLTLSQVLNIRLALFSVIIVWCVAEFISGWYLLKAGRIFKKEDNAHKKNVRGIWMVIFFCVVQVITFTLMNGTIITFMMLEVIVVPFLILDLIFILGDIWSTYDSIVTAHMLLKNLKEKDKKLRIAEPEKAIEPQEETKNPDEIEEPETEEFTTPITAPLTAEDSFAIIKE